MLQNLNDDCLIEIFQYLNLEEQLNVTLVDERFRELIVERIWRIKYSYYEIKTFSHMLPLQKYPMFLRLLAPHITHLTLQNEKEWLKEPYRDFGFYLMYPELRVLYCYRTDVRNDCLMAMARNSPKLEKLVIKCNGTTGKYLSEMKNLRYLSMRAKYAASIEPIYFQKMFNNQKIEEVILCNIRVPKTQEWNNVLKKIFPKITALSLYDTHFSADVLNSWAHLFQNLETLHVGCIYCGEDLTNFIYSLHTLKKLCLDSHSTVDLLKLIDNNKNLEHLYLKEYLAEEYLCELSELRRQQQKEEQCKRLLNIYIYKYLINILQRTLEENDLKWHSESNEAQELFFDKRSISSESSNSDAVFSDEAHEIFLWQQQHQMIWGQDEIEDTLSVGPNSKAVHEMVKANSFVELIPASSDANLALLYSSIYGCFENVLYLLDHYGADPNCKDMRGRTPLHFACCRANAHIAKVLLDRGADPNRFDGKKEVTPLHCAASAKSVECILLLLKRKAHINIGIEKRSALHFAIDRNAVECVETLLKYGADPNTPQVYTETPLHTACALGFSKCVELLLHHGADVRSQFGEGKLTALHLAAENDYVDCVRLLLEHGAEVDCRDASHQTPLHLACLSQSIETVDLLIKHGANVNAIYRDGRTALHAAIVKQSRSLDCCNALLKAGANVNKADIFGYTPLHNAALNEFSNCVYTFIEHGADITARTLGNVSALSYIVRRTPEIIPKLTAKMDSSIKVNDHEIGDVDCEIKLDFRLLVPPTSFERGETELLLALIEVGQKRLLMHPLCETFLFLKWRRIRKFFLMSLFYHAIYVILFTMYIVGVYARNCDNNPKCEAHPYISTVGYFVIILNLILMGKEIFQMAHGLQGYAKYWENWLQWAIVFGVLLCVTPEILVPSNLLAVPKWQHHIAAIVVLLVWLELMMLVGRFPIFGVYVQMFTKVAGNFCKFLLAYICLLIGFCLSFSVLFNDYPPFESITWSLLKAITMMSGELEFEDIFFGDKPVKFPVTAHILFLCFVLLVTVILTNLMVGLAVSDIQGLQVSATLDRLVRQAELISRLESLFFSRLLRRAPVKLLQLCKRSALLRTSRNKLQFVTRPNDPRDNKLPEDIKINIYKLVAERRDRNLSLRRRKLESNYNMFNQSLQRQYAEKKRVTAIPAMGGGSTTGDTVDISKVSKNNKVNNNNSNKLCNDLKEPPSAVVTLRENDYLLRPRSATNVHDQLMAESDVAVKLKSQVNGISDVRAEVLSLRQQLNEISQKFDAFAESAGKKLTFTAEEMCRIKIHLEQKASFQC